MKTAEKRFQKLESSVDGISKVIKEATEEAVPTENAPQKASSKPLRFWLPLNAAKWMGIFSASCWTANIVIWEHLIAWKHVFPFDWEFWIMLEGVFAGVSLGVAIGIEIFFLIQETHQKPRNQQYNPK